MKIVHKSQTASTGTRWEQQGRVLTGVENEWADEYARLLEKSEKYTFHLREAGRLDNSSAAPSARSAIS